MCRCPAAPPAARERSKTPYERAGIDPARDFVRDGIARAGVGGTGSLTGAAAMWSRRRRRTR
jgi:hypothetical protein